MRRRAREDLQVWMRALHREREDREQAEEALEEAEVALARVLAMADDWEYRAEQMSGHPVADILAEHARRVRACIAPPPGADVVPLRRTAD